MYTETFTKRRCATLIDTITITFPEVKVNTEIKDLTFDILENMIFEISQNIAHKVFEKAITDIGDYLRSKKCNISLSHDNLMIYL